MISRISDRLAGVLENGGAIQAEDREVFAYGLEVLISSCANALLLLAAGLLIGRLPETAFFMLFFAVLRGTAGGYHAGTHAACMAIMVGAYGTAMATLLLLPAGMLPWVSLACAGASVAAVAVLAPVPHENKPLSREELRKFRKLSIFMVAGEAGVVGLLWVTGVVYLGSAAALGMIAAAASLMAAFIKSMNKKRLRQTL